MSTVQKFYAAKKAAEGLIDPSKKVVHIVSKNSLGEVSHEPVVMLVSRDTATRMLAKGNHELATDEQAAKHDEQEKKNKHDVESKRTLPITAETIAQIALAANKTKGKGEN